MRIRAPALAPLALLLVMAPILGACGSTPSPTDSGEERPGAPPTEISTLDGALFPVEVPEAQFALSRGRSAAVRVEAGPGADASTLFFKPPEAPARSILVRRSDAGLFFANGPQTGTELIRFGSAPGAEWSSGQSSITFDGWERVEVPAGTYDAARIRCVRGTEEVMVTETWWFARGVGLVRLKTDRAGVFSETMERASP